MFYVYLGNAGQSMCSISSDYTPAASMFPLKFCQLRPGESGAGGGIRLRVFYNHNTFIGGGRQAGPGGGAVHSGKLGGLR